ncbi:MAG: undecaprenyl-diphosphatase UppP [Chloroflexi bacterium]|nr:undecaprenyl-diphosphatase UppP [Chloroflexota bacterium]
MTELLQAILLGIAQGITEFAPISSTAHLVLIPWLFGWESPLLNSLTFDVALHMGTLAATLWYFSREWERLLRAGLASLRERSLAGDPWRRLAWLVLLATIPGVVAGALLEDQAEELFRAPWLVAATLILLGLALALAERWGAKHRDMLDLEALPALAMGLGQALAIVPGVSRSGGTMTVGLLVGLERQAAARFSFLMATPIMAGAGLKKLPTILSLGASAGEATVMLAGFLSSAVVGYLCIKYLLRYLQFGTLYPFVWYRLALGAVVLVVYFARGG